MLSKNHDSAARTFLYSAVFWLAAGSVALLVAWLKLLDPDFLSTRILSYPRVRAIASLSLIYGWILLAALASIFYIIPRVTGARIRSERGGQTSAWLINVGLSFVVVTTMLGDVSGHEFAELPRWLGWVLVVALALCAFNVVRTVERRVEPKIYVSVLYFIGALVWAPLVIAGGSIVSLTGAKDSIAHLFGVGALMNAVLPAAGIGAVYYLVPRTSGRPLYSHRLAMLGFWWLAFTAPLTGQAMHIFGPSQDWLQTLAITASIALLLPVMTVVVNVFATLRGGWHEVGDHPSIRFCVGGVLLWAFAVLVGTALSFRSVARVVGLTSLWTTQVWLLVIAFTLMAAGSITYSFPRLVGRRWFRRDRVTIHFWLTVAGGLLLALGGWASGIVTGTIWQTSAVSGVPSSFGDNFMIVLTATDRLVAVAVAGVVLFVIAQWVFVMNLFRSTTLGEPRPIEVVAAEDEPPTAESVRNSRIAVAGVAIVFIAALAVGYAAPIADAAIARQTDYTLTYSSQTPAPAGRSIYVTEGCWYCHTQSVRAVPADLELGTVTTADRVARDSPTVFGLSRIGPDLACVGGRFTEADQIIDHLTNPRRLRTASVMPKYDYLSDRQLAALATYLLQLTCEAKV